MRAVPKERVWRVLNAARVSPVFEFHRHCHRVSHSVLIVISDEKSSSDLPLRSRQVLLARPDENLPEESESVAG